MKRYTVAFLVVASFFLNACVHTAQICEFTPVYKSTFSYKASINDVEVPINSNVFQDNNVKVTVLVDTSSERIIVGITNLKGDLMNYRTIESCKNGNFVETIPASSPWLPKGESFVFSFPLFLKTTEKGEYMESRIVLLDKRDYFDLSDYKKFRDKFYSQVEKLKNMRPSSSAEDSYFSFVVRFFNGEYYYYRISYTCEKEGIGNDYKIFERQYRDASELN